jgi:hypothetical protein
MQVGVLRSLLDPIPLPRMVRIRQKFDESAINDVAAHLEAELAKPGGIERIQAGQQVAICVGSRGIANIAEAARTVVKAVRTAGAHPFIIPCMGSHGGATAQGQANVLMHLGITEETVGAPIRSSMEVAEIGKLSNGLPICADMHAFRADAIIPINRVKPHTAFRGPVESGVMKMIAIGLGKQRGADAYHRLGFKEMAGNILDVGRILLKKLPIVFGVALLENAYDRTCRIEVLPAERIESREQQLLVEAKALMPRIWFDQIDVLVIDRIGKNISGSGLDPNITGRYPTPYAHGGPDVTRIVILDLTEESNGNGNGMGIADYSTRKLLDKVNLADTYANGLTSTVCLSNKIPILLENDCYAIKAAIKTSNILDFTTCRLVRIPDTLQLGEIEISESMLEEAANIAGIETASAPYPFEFDHEGNLHTAY